MAATAFTNHRHRCRTGRPTPQDSTWGRTIFGMAAASAYPRKFVMWGEYNLMLLAETNIPDVVYCHSRLAYDVICSHDTVTTSRGS